MSTLSIHMRPAHTKRRPIRVLAHPEVQTTRVRDSRAIFELTKALKSADKALIVWTLRGWIAHNQAHKKGYRDGHYWTFNSLDRWQAKHFPWLTVKQLGALMTQLVKQGLVIRTRRSVHSCYWYRVNESALSSLCASILPANTLRSQTAGQTDKTAGQNPETSEHKTEVSKKENLKQGKDKNQDTTTDCAAVVGLEPQSVQYSASSERQATTTVKAVVGQEQPHNDKPFQKVPLKSFSTDNTVYAELIRFGVTPTGARQIVRRYTEADIRYVLECARAATSLTNPPGFVVRELERGAAGVLGLRDVQGYLRPKRDPSVVAWEERIRRDMERMVAEDAENSMA